MIHHATAQLVAKTSPSLLMVNWFLPSMPMFAIFSFIVEMFVTMSIIDKWFASTCLAESVALLLATVVWNQCFTESSMWPLRPCQEQGSIGSGPLDQFKQQLPKLELWATSYATVYFLKQHGLCSTTIALLPPITIALLSSRYFFELWMLHKLYFKLVALVCGVDQ